MSWKQAITDISTRVLQKRHMPLAAKEVAWRALAFAVRCRKSNPLSFALRPIFSHKHLHVGVGLAMIIGLTSISLISPFASQANNNTGGGPVSLSVLPEGEVNPTTRESVKVPTKYTYISQGFWPFHPGVDFASKIGEPVNPVMDGVVSQVLYDKWDYGTHIVIAHANKYSSLYAHLSKIDVKVGQVVTTSTTIGEVGSTGRSTGPHLHFEIHDELDRPINPTTFLGVK
jgi:murein DD-endopeptidase MepM/ murein hydrolase activator NlpD